MTTCEKFAVIEETLRGEGNLLQVGMLCEIASVSRSGYYRWKHAAATRAAKERQDELPEEDKGNPFKDNPLVN